jgi:alpha-methylacyl-CoA racemase
MDRSKWPELKEKIAAIFRTKTRDEWCEEMENTDVCFAPVLTFEEAKNHPHNVARGTFVEVGGVMQPAPAPRFNRTKPDIPKPAPEPGEHTESALKEWGFTDDDITGLRVAGAI